MVNRKEIWNELKEISPFLSKLEPVELFQVPIGYFDALASDTLSLIRAGENPSPSGELNSISSLVGSAGKRHVFSIPEGYFEVLASAILNKIKDRGPVSVDEELETLSPLLSRVERKSPFSLPSGYFEKLPLNAISGSKEIDHEEESFSPLMASLKDRNPFWIPAGYFEELSGEIISKIRPKRKSAESARVFSISSRFKWVRYAAAAIIIGAIATTSVFLFRTDGSGRRLIASLDEKQLADSLHNANEKDILDYMQSHDLPLPDSTANLAQFGLDNKDELGGMLADISDTELQQYVDDYTGSKEQTIN